MDDCDRIARLLDAVVVYRDHHRYLLVFPDGSAWKMSRGKDGERNLLEIADRLGESNTIPQIGEMTIGDQTR